MYNSQYTSAEGMFHKDQLLSIHSVLHNFPSSAVERSTTSCFCVSTASSTVQSHLLPGQALCLLPAYIGQNLPNLVF